MRLSIAFIIGFLLATALYANIALFTDIFKTERVVIYREKASSLEPLYIPTKVNNVSVIERSVPVVAVTTDGKGVVGTMTVKLIPGNNNVLLDTNPFVETDLQYSANVAIAVAKQLAKNYAYDRDFIISFNVDSQLIGGESAGAAMTIAAFAAIENRKIRDDVAITGTINPDGRIGKVGGVLEKAKAAADAGYSVFLVPKGQSKITYYEEKVKKEPFGFGIYIYNRYYVPKTIDIKEMAKKEWGLNVIEVENIEDAIRYMVE